MSFATLTTPPTTPPPTPPTTVPTKTYLIRITRYNAEESAGSRIMSIPGETCFKVFYAAVATAIGWNNEPCTFWSFENTKKSPLVALTLLGEPACFYGFIPSQLDDHSKLNEWMSLETRCRFWLYSTHLSRQQHTIDVMGIVAGDKPRIISFWRGRSAVDKQQAGRWEDIDAYSMIQAIQGLWEINVTRIYENMEPVQAESQTRISCGSVVSKAETYIKKEDDGDDGVVVRPDRGTKRKLPGSFRSDHSHKKLRS